MKINVIVPLKLAQRIQVEIVPSVMCPNDTFYIMPEKSMDLLTHLRSIYSAEKERSEWIRSYDNALKGLNYWKARALENE